MEVLSPSTEITYISGVGPKKAEILRGEIHVGTVEDMLFHFPYKYVDRSRFYNVADIVNPDIGVQIRGKFCCFTDEGQGNKKYLHGKFFDSTGSISVIWFQRIKWIKNNIDIDKEYVISGKPKQYKSSFSIVHPEFEEAGKFDNQIKSIFYAEYSSTDKMKRAYLSSKMLRKIIRTIFEKKIVLSEVLPKDIRDQYSLPDINYAIREIHFPQSIKSLTIAQKRLKFEELLINQLSLLKQKKVRITHTKGFLFKNIGDYFLNFYHNNLPFALTNAQKRVLREIRADFNTGKQCNRLLQGDVGSGKTIVALMSMLIAIDNDFQACLMAPTEILAVQHFESIKELTRGLGLNVELLTGSTKMKRRRLIDEQAQAGELHILIGTHALIEKKVIFKNLGVAIIDEQHRFGVAQRAKLQQKNTIPPHIIVMTATPIPRTLSMTLYGDLDISVIDELPAGRKSIITKHFYEKQRAKLYTFINKEIEKGRQIYFVFPLIKESESLDYKNIEAGYQHIIENFRPPKYRVSIVHGQMKTEDKKSEMDKFISGVSQILVATTVIEVGVNIPNASVMVIESAERFGLSQLHQLRGRVGRGSEQSFCILMTSYKLSADSRKRINTMVRTNDGFEIAEEDLHLRGPGDMFGTQQSGVPLKFKIANLMTDSKILSFARKCASEIIDKDLLTNSPQYKNLKTKVDYDISNSWGNVS